MAGGKIPANGDGGDTVSLSREGMAKQAEGAEPQGGGSVVDVVIVVVK